MARILHCPNCDAIIDESVFGTGSTVTCEYCKSVILLDPNERKVLTVDDRARIAREEYRRRQQEYEEKKKRWYTLNRNLIIANCVVHFVLAILNAFSSRFEDVFRYSASFMAFVFMVVILYRRPAPLVNNESKNSKIKMGFLFYFMHVILAILVFFSVTAIINPGYKMESSSTNISPERYAITTTTKETEEQIPTEYYFSTKGE